MPLNRMLQLELLWWVLSLAVTALIMLPIAIYTQGYPFWVPNVVYILTFLTFTRYLFLLRFSFFAHLTWFKLLLLFACIPIAFFLIQELNTFQVFVDYNETEDLVGLLPYATMESMRAYIYNEYLLFGVGSIICTVLLPFRLVISIWRSRNTGKV